MVDTHPPDFVTRWLSTLSGSDLADVAPDPGAAAIFSTDMIDGFLRTGELASPRVNALADPVAACFRTAWGHGIREFVLLQDSHDPETPEFDAYPPHCIVGTREARTIRELADLPTAEHYTIIPKNSLNPAIETAFNRWLDDHPKITTAIVVGNSTDLCVYQLAMHLRMRANARNLSGYEVIVPADLVQAFDITEQADALPGRAHPGDFFHGVFLYHMAMNGIRIVTTVSGASGSPPIPNPNLQER